MEPKSGARTSSRSVVPEFNPPAENLSLWETVWCPNLNSIQQRLRCLHTFGHVVQPVATWHVSMVSSLSLSLQVEWCSITPVAWWFNPDQVLFRRWLLVVLSLLHAAWDKPLSGSRERNTLRNILCFSGCQVCFHTGTNTGLISISNICLSQK